MTETHLAEARFQRRHRDRLFARLLLPGERGSIRAMTATLLIAAVLALVAIAAALS